MTKKTDDDYDINTAWILNSDYKSNKKHILEFTDLDSFGCVFLKRRKLKTKIMNRRELIEQLDKVQWNIETVEKQVNQKLEDSNYYKIFGYGKESEFYHLKEIRTKALAFWKRKFNRIIKELKY